MHIQFISSVSAWIFVSVFLFHDMTVGWKLEFQKHTNRKKKSGNIWIPWLLSGFFLQNTQTSRVLYQYSFINTLIWDINNLQYVILFLIKTTKWMFQMLPRSYFSTDQINKISYFFISFQLHETTHFLLSLTSLYQPLFLSLFKVN